MDKLANIEELAAQEFEARMHLEALGMMNTTGLSYDDRKKQAIEYAQARYDHAQVKSRLESAISLDLHGQYYKV